MGRGRGGAQTLLYYTDAFPLVALAVVKHGIRFAFFNQS